jgi:hypothetical protein
LKTKLLAAVFVPALALAASATYAMGDKVTPQSNAGNTATTPPATSSSMQNSMKSGTSSADAIFDRLDKNHDGKLSSTEAAADPKVHAMWKNLDENNNGTVTKAEFEAHASTLK